jgi:short-subunit dehydrogenase
MEKGQFQRLKGKSVVITGSSSGLGRSIALAFARQGARIYLIARNEHNLEEVVVACKEEGGFALAGVADTGDYGQLKRALTQVIEHFGTIDYWVNNAGVLAVGKFDEVPMRLHEALIRTNLLGYMNAAHLVLPIFKRQGHGVMINNISVGAWFPTPYMAAYAASKAGLASFFDSVREELSQWKEIRICDVFPGFLDTPGMQHAANYTGKEIVPVPPLFRPARIADHIVQIIDHPQNKSTVGFFPSLLRLSYQVSPTLSTRVTGSVIERYLKGAHKSERTPGNVLEPLSFGTSEEGGWTDTLRQKMEKKTQRIGLVLAFAAVGLLLLTRRR